MKRLEFLVRMVAGAVATVIVLSLGLVLSGCAKKDKYAIYHDNSSFDMVRVYDAGNMTAENCRWIIKYLNDHEDNRNRTFYCELDKGE